MPAAIGNTSVFAASTASLVWSHTLGTGSDLVLTVCVTLGPLLPTINSVTWDADGVNESLTLLRQDTNTGDGATAIYYLVNPSAATGSSEITVALSAKVVVTGVGATWTGATTPDNATGGNADSHSSPITHTVSGVGADDMVQDSVRCDNNPGSWTVGANQTTITSSVVGGDRQTHTYQDGADGGVMSYTYNGTVEYSHTACRIPAAAADVAYELDTPGVLTLTGLAADTRTDLFYESVEGVLTLTGLAGDFSVAYAYELNDPGVLALAGLAATVDTTFDYESVEGVLTLTGLAATVDTTFNYESVEGVLTITGLVATVDTTFNYESVEGVLTLTGLPATVDTTFDYESVEGVLTLTGLAGDIAISVSYELNNPGILTLTGLAATVDTTFDYESVEGLLTLTGLQATVDTTFDYESVEGVLTLTGLAADYLEQVLYDATPGELALTGLAADVLQQVFYESTPGEIALTGLVADTELEIGLEFEPAPGALFLTGLKAEIQMPLPAVRAAAGVRRSVIPLRGYPRRIQIFGRRYTVRSPQEEKDLLERLIAQERARAERPADIPSQVQAAAKARVRVKRIGNRIRKLDSEIDTRQAYTRKLNQDLVLIVAATPWL